MFFFSEKCKSFHPDVRWPRCSPTSPKRPVGTTRTPTRRSGARSQIFHQKSFLKPDWLWDSSGPNHKGNELGSVSWQKIRISSLTPNEYFHGKYPGTRLLARGRLQGRRSRMQVRFLLLRRNLAGSPNEFIFIQVKNCFNFRPISNTCFHLLSRVVRGLVALARSTTAAGQNNFRTTSTTDRSPTQ